VQQQLPELKEAGVLTFLDFVELFLVARWRQAGVSMQTIRRNARLAKDRFETNHPFAVKRFHVSGRELIAETVRELPGQPPQRLYEELQKSQLVLDRVIESFFTKLDYEGDLPRQYWPAGPGGLVVLNPDRSFGKPIDPQTGVPTRVLYEMHAAGESVEGIARWYRVTPEAVVAAVEFEKSLPQAA
jgi:uncharacterized protein (DUF433 family)